MRRGCFENNSLLTSSTGGALEGKVSEFSFFMEARPQHKHEFNEKHEHGKPQDFREKLRLRRSSS